MNTKTTKLETLKDLRDFLNNVDEEFLTRTPYILIGDNESADRINTIEVFNEDHINPSGECLEPLSVYSESEDEEDRQLAKDETPVYRKGDLFLVGGWAVLPEDVSIAAMPEGSEKVAMQAKLDGKLKEAFDYIYQKGCDKYINTPYMLIGDVAVLVTILTGLEVLPETIVNYIEEKKKTINTEKH